MNFAPNSLYLCVLLGSCSLLVSQGLLANDQSAPSVSKLTSQDLRATHRGADILGRSQYVVKAKTPLEKQDEVVLSPIIATEPKPATETEQEAVNTNTETQPPSIIAHEHVFAGSDLFLRENSFADEAGLSIPPAYSFTDVPALTIPTYGFPDSRMSVGDCIEFDGLKAVGTNRPRQYAAPEAVLRFSRGCADAKFSNWSLSSRDVPAARPSIPHGPLLIEVRIASEPNEVVNPIDFVELMFDGRPLQPNADSTASPLRYELPCPAPGQHWLQARYLSGNIWSHYSQAIRFEVRLPTEPKIIAASDSDRDPTPLSKNSIASITTHSIKVHLANVNRDDNVVAYIDGKPLPPSSDEHFDSNPDQVPMDSHLCCRVFRVQGVVTPGVHKLTVRVVGCSGACSITSEPSNTVAFHYYDEDIYLLRPGAGCNCKEHDTIFSKINLPSQLDPGREDSTPNFIEFQRKIQRSSPTPIEKSISQFVFYQQPLASEDAIREYKASVNAMEQTPNADTVQAQVTQNVGSINGTKKALQSASTHLSTAETSLKEAFASVEQSRASAMRIKRELNNAKVFEQRSGAGDSALAEVSKLRRFDALAHAEVANEQLILAERYYTFVNQSVRNVLTAVDMIKNRIAAAEEFGILANSHFSQLSDARSKVEEAVKDAGKAYDREIDARKNRDEKAANRALEEITRARDVAKYWAEIAKTSFEKGKQFSTEAKNCCTRAWLEAANCKAAANDAERDKNVVNQAYRKVNDQAELTAESANSAGRVLNMKDAAVQAWHEAQEAGAYEAALASKNAAKGGDENGVRLTLESADTAEKRAAQEWSKAASRIIEAEANANRSRAENVRGPSSPFYFASTAHFPLRDFGLRGEPLDRDGILIYEDMAFHFDRHGNYEVHFRASAPAMPATMRLQFQIQTHRNGPWYTVTLAPIEFPYPPVKSEKSSCLGSTCGAGHSGCNDDSKDCCGKARECICKGHSEILRRCFGEMGQDAKIRRSGTARIGFGVNVP